MRSMLTTAVVALFVVPLTQLPAIADERPASEMQVELKKFQGLWQTSPGGIEHQNGQQVVRNPVLDGPCFFVCGNKLIWLDDEGKPNGKEESITLDVQAEPKRITLTPKGGKDEKSSHGIYRATGSSVIIHLGLDGGAAPKQFLELNKAVQGVDGTEWLVSRKKLKGK